ncbi:helix-turn-helix transcriptional regulator [uncultured Gemella sp.]|uniref:helix-turn-helix domain-containing protein n=1 Tax=uncultured Gemella sp. TaxID=254352 RepID=UPI0028D016A0|nr:helix-turn-helix transcriptional regulator [uncultured Gemella sp.]
MKTKINKKAVGSRIRQIRLNKGYTLESFGKLFGASKGNVQQWENGVSLPNKERLTTIAKIADMTVNELVYGSVDEFLKFNYEKIITHTHRDHGELILKTINISNFLKFIKDKKLDNSLLNDLDNLLEIIWDLSNDYIMNTKQKTYTTEKGSYIISDDLYKLIQALKILESHKDKTNNRAQLDDTIESFYKVINMYLEDKIESTPIDTEYLDNIDN